MQITKKIGELPISNSINENGIAIKVEDSSHVTGTQTKSYFESIGSSNNIHGNDEINRDPNIDPKQTSENDVFPLVAIETDTDEAVIENDSGSALHANSNIIISTNDKDTTNEPMTNQNNTTNDTTHDLRINDNTFSIKHDDDNVTDHKQTTKHTVIKAQQITDNIRTTNKKTSHVNPDRSQMMNKDIDMNIDKNSYMTNAKVADTIETNDDTVQMTQHSEETIDTETLFTQYDAEVNKIVKLITILNDIFNTRMGINPTGGIELATAVSTPAMDSNPLSENNEKPTESLSTATKVEAEPLSDVVNGEDLKYEDPLKQLRNNEGNVEAGLTTVSSDRDTAFDPVPDPASVSGSSSPCLCPSSTTTGADTTTTSPGTITASGECICPDLLGQPEVETATNFPLTPGRQRRRRRGDLEDPDMDLFVDDFDQKIMKKMPFLKFY